MDLFDSLKISLESNRELEALEAQQLMGWLMSGEAREDEILAVLNWLCDKGVTVSELVAFAEVMRDKSVRIEHQISKLVDTCGTGGGRPTFNISTAAAFVAAAAGARIAKHGNRSTSGQGSADVLEKVGLRLESDPVKLLYQLENVGIAFLFAPAHHPAMRHVAAARKALGRRSVFNLLGPLSNPAKASRQLIGIYNPSHLELMAEAVVALGIERAVLVHSYDGLDEISPCSETQAIIVVDGKMEWKVIRPEDFEVERIRFEEIKQGTDLAESEKFFTEAISDLDSPRAQAVIPSAAVAIWLAGLELDFKLAAMRARHALRDRKALLLLQRLRELGEIR